MKFFRPVLLATLLFSAASPGHSNVITGSYDWVESTTLTVGSPAANVSMFWSVANGDLGLGWFYGSGYGINSDVAWLDTVTSINDVTDLSSVTFQSGYIGPVGDAAWNGGVGSFLAWHNLTSGIYGVIYVDDIYPLSDTSSPYASAKGTWWVQTDGTSNFSAAVPEQTNTLMLLGLALSGLFVRRSASRSKAWAGTEPSQ